MDVSLILIGSFAEDIGNFESFKLEPFINQLYEEL